MELSECYSQHIKPIFFLNRLIYVITVISYHNHWVHRSGQGKALLQEKAGVLVILYHILSFLQLHSGLLRLYLMEGKPAFLPGILQRFYDKELKVPCSIFKSM